MKKTKGGLLNPWLRDLADWLMENAETYGGVRKKGWLAAASQHFGVTPGWIATVLHTDAFEDYLARRLKAGEKPRNNC
jgi:hypothetical protein